MIGPTCPTCGHVGHPTIAVGKFNPDGPLGYSAAGDYAAPLRVTREEAQADQCVWQRGGRPS